MLEAQRTRRARTGFVGASIAAHGAILALAAWPSLRPRPPVPIEVLILAPQRAPGLRQPGPPAAAPAPPAARRPAPGAVRARRPLFARAAQPSAAPDARRPLPSAAVELEPAELPAAAGGEEGAGEIGFAGEGAPVPQKPPSLSAGGGISGLAADDVAWLRLHRREILARLQRVHGSMAYPALAQLRGWSGIVRVAFTIRPDGRPHDVHVHETSGRAILDRAAVEAVRSAGPFPRPPDDVGLVVPVVFALSG